MKEEIDKLILELSEQAQITIEEAMQKIEFVMLGFSSPSEDLAQMFEDLGNYKTPYKPDIPKFDNSIMTHKFQHKLPKWQRRR